MKSITTQQLQRILQGLLHIMLILCLVAGLGLVETALPRLIYADGVDRALPGDEVGELEVLSTRSLFIDQQSLLRFVGGLLMIGGGLGLHWRLNKRLQTSQTSSPDAAHDRQ
ncbi:MAG: hypothetical protein ACLFTK_14185 [Anaerolineales bacterium]